MRVPTLLPTVPFVPDRLLAPEQAIVSYLGGAALRAPRLEHVALDDAAGRILAADAAATADVPSHARSTMDGFAVCVAAGAEPRTIVGEVRMGRPAPRAIAGTETLRIPTGGALPAGADAVVPLEDVDEADGRIVLRGTVAAGDYFTPAGADIRAGETLLQAGRRLGAPELGVLATLGLALVPVFARPHVVVLSTGDELVDPAATLQTGEVRDSNRYAIAASLRAMGAAVTHGPRVADTPEALHGALAAALAAGDAVVLSGGSSVGARDLVPPVVRALGTPGPIVHGLRVKPGKPTMLAAVDGRAIIGLPGNPTSSLTILEAVVRPIVAALTGERHARPVRLEAIASAAFTGKPGWTWFVPARLRLAAGTLAAEPLLLRSAHTSLLARATGFVTLPESAPLVEAGERVAVTLFSAGGAPIETA